MVPDGVEQIANSCCARAQLRITTPGLRMKPVGGEGGQSLDWRSVGGGRWPRDVRAASHGWALGRTPASRIVDFDNPGSFEDFSCFP